MKKDKKWGIIIAIIVIVVIAAAICVMILTKDKKSSANVKNPIVNNSESVDLNQILKAVNDINAKFTKESLSENGSFEEEEKICYQYITDNPIYIMEDIQKVYMNPFADPVPFNIVTSYYNDDVEVKRLYVCLPKNCEIASIENFEITKDDNLRKEIKLNSDNDAVLIKTGDGWKFEKPIMICK